MRSRAAPVPWNEWTLGFQHRQALAGPLEGAFLLVGMLGFHDHDRQWFLNFVNVFDPSGKERTIPAGLQRSVRRELRAAGYRLGKGPGALFGTKEASTAKRAVSECKRMLSRLSGTGFCFD